MGQMLNKFQLKKSKEQKNAAKINLFRLRNIRKIKFGIKIFWNKLFNKWGIWIKNLLSGSDDQPLNVMIMSFYIFSYFFFRITLTEGTKVKILNNV